MLSPLPKEPFHFGSASTSIVNAHPYPAFGRSLFGATFGFQVDGTTLMYCCISTTTFKMLKISPIAISLLISAPLCSSYLFLKWILQSQTNFCNTCFTVLPFYGSLNPPLDSRKRLSIYWLIYLGTVVADLLGWESFSMLAMSLLVPWWCQHAFEVTMVSQWAALLTAPQAARDGGSARSGWRKGWEWVFQVFLTCLSDVQILCKIMVSSSEEYCTFHFHVGWRKVSSPDV